MKKGRFSRNSVNTLDQFTFTLKGNEKLSNNEMIAIKGGDGEIDGGTPPPPPPPSPIPTPTPTLTSIPPLIPIYSNASKDTSTSPI